MAKKERERENFGKLEFARILDINMHDMHA